MASEKFCLKWNDFTENISGSFKELRKDLDFCDVTLVSDDNQPIEAHKVILAASSPIFKDMLRSNKHSHPMIFMRGVKMADLAAVVDFMYHGETNIFQENIDNFLGLAQELKLKGLSGENSSQGVLPEERIRSVEEKVESFVKSFDEDKLPYNFKTDEVLEEINEVMNETSNIKKENSVAHETSWKNEANFSNNSISSFSNVSWENDHISKIDKSLALVPTEQIQKPVISVNADFDNLNQKMDSILERVNGIWTCNICGKTSKGNNKKDMKRHAETHIEGVSYPCNQCGRTLRCSQALVMHMKISHGQ